MINAPVRSDTLDLIGNTPIVKLHRLAPNNVDIHVKVDNCVGASSLRSYAILTSSTADDDDIVAYYGATKVF